MIEYIKGELTELTPATAVVEAAGVGYALNISLNTYSTIQGKKEVKLYVHENLVTGGREVVLRFLGRGHTGHDLVVEVEDARDVAEALGTRGGNVDVLHELGLAHAHVLDAQARGVHAQLRHEHGREHLA